MYRVRAADQQAQQSQDPRGSTYQDYRDKKQQKLNEELEKTNISNLFQNQLFMLNGRLEPSAQLLRQMIGKHGGRVVFQYIPGVNYMVCQNLSASKFMTYSKKNIPIVLPQYILACIHHTELLPTKNYLLPEIAENNNIQQTQQSQQQQFTMDQLFHNYNFQKPELEQKDYEIFDHIHRLEKQFPISKAGDLLLPNTELMRQSVSQGSQSPVKQLFLQQQSPIQKTKKMYDVQEYHKSSRLHHLSMWKVEIQDYLLDNPPFGPKPLDQQQDLFMHVDIDCFFVQASYLQLSPQKQVMLQSLPLCVSSNFSQSNNSTADISSCNYIARDLGLKNGMWLGEARKLAPNLVILKYDFDFYKQLSFKFYEVIRPISSQVMPVSCDECYVKLTGLVKDKFAFMNELKIKIKNATQLNVTIGIGNSLVQARIATKLGKPNGAVQLDKEQFCTEIKTKKVDFLPSIGYETKQKLNENQIFTVQDLQQANKQTLKELFGDLRGVQLQDLSFGKDTTAFQPVNISLESMQKTLQVSMNFGVRCKNIIQLKEVVISCLNELQQRVTQKQIRLSKIKLFVSIKQKNADQKYAKNMGCGICDKVSGFAVLNNRQNIEISQYTDQLVNSVIDRIKIEDVRGIDVQGIVQNKNNSIQQNKETKINQLTENPMAKNSICDAILQQFQSYHHSQQSTQILHYINVDLTQQQVNKIKDIDLKSEIIKILLIQLIYCNKSLDYQMLYNNNKSILSKVQDDELQQIYNNHYRFVFE